MARGRPKKLTADNSTLKLSKAELAEREAKNKALEEFEELSENPPTWLDRQGKLEYRRIVKLLKKELPIATLDRTLVASYANLYSQYVKLSKDVNEHGAVIITTDEEGNEVSRRVNPSWNAFLNTQKELRSTLSQLGMTPASRLDLIEVDKEVEEDEFLKLLKGG